MYGNMFAEAFEQARMLEDNKDAVRRFAIEVAWDILTAAGVVDPEKAVEQPFFVISEGTGIRFTLNIGGKSVEQLETEVKKVRIVGGYAPDMMRNPKFTTLEKVTPQELLKLRVQDLGLSGTPTTSQVIERITHSRIGNMVLEFCRAEVGLHQAIADTEQPLNDVYYIVHEPLIDRRGDPYVFGLERYVDGLWLNDRWAGPDNEWDPEAQLVVALRNIEPVKA